MSEQSLELLDRIRRRLQTAARRITLADVLFGLALSLGITSGVWLITTGIEAGLWLETGARTVLFWLVVTTVGLSTAYFLVVPLLRLAGVLSGPSEESIAEEIGRRFPEVGDRLINLLDLSKGRRSDAPDELVDGAVRMLGRDVEPVPFERVGDYSRARRAVRVALIPFVSLLLFVAAAPGTFFDASRRVLSPGTYFDEPAPFQLVVEPGSIEMTRGASLDIRVRALGGELPRTIVLGLQNEGEEHVETVRLTADSAHSFSHTIANVRRAFRYRVSATPVTSPWHSVSVAEHPLIRGLQVSLQFPSYSAIPPQRLDPNVGDVSGLRGTRVNLDLSLGGSDAANAFILFDDSTTAPLDVASADASGSFILTRSGSYQVVVENDRGVRNRDPIRYAMSVVDDAPPAVVIIRPETDALLDESLRRLVESRISDDFGFHDVTLHYRLAESRFGTTTETFESLPLPLRDPRQLDQSVQYDWQIGDATLLDPVPGDVIEYYVRVRDNDAVAGYKSAVSSRHRLRLPSLAEQYEALNRDQDVAESQMENLLDEARRLDDQFDELRDEVRRKQDADWEDQRQLQQLEQQQQEMESQVDQLSRQIESMNRSAQQNNLLSDETLEMYDEMQSVVEEISSPELRDALRQLQEAVENLDLSQMQEAIENFEFNEQQFQQRLERALELFKNLRAQQSIEEAARRAEELARQQEQLAEKTAELLSEDENDEPAVEEGQRDPSDGENTDAPEDPSDAASGDPSEQEPDENGSDMEGDTSDDGSSQDPSNPNSENEPGDRTAPENDESKASRQDQLARQQELSQEEMRQLEELMQQAQEQLEQLRKGPAQEMQQLNEGLQQQQLPQQMEDNAQQLRQNQLQDAQSGQQQMQQQLQQLQNQLSQMQSSMQGSQMQVNVAGLRRALSDILTLSQDQESLRKQLRTNVSEAPSLREDARRQVELSEGLNTVIDSLQALSQSIPQMSRSVQRLSGQALREMGQATDAMTSRSVGEAAGYQTAAMMNLNELALLLSDVLNQLMNQSGQGGGGNMQQMIQQMQQMAQQQQQLNQQIQQFLNDMQGSRLSVDMQQRLQQMSGQQQSIKQQLDELRRNPEARGNLLGDLDRIAEQMEETIGELQQRQVEPRTIERQRQILQRLLDAQRSLNERGQERRREAQEGEDLRRDSPADLTPEDAVERLRRDLIRALDSGYAPDYEELIKRYFELLQQQQMNEAE